MLSCEGFPPVPRVRTRRQPPEENKRRYKQQWQEKYELFKDNIDKTYQKAVFEDGCIGNISELYDSKKPFLPKGTIAQAWSVSEVLKILTEEE